MGYRITQFGSVLIPKYFQAGDTQNMGTGEALTSYQQLPGGSFYDNYTTSTSPQGIRPILKSGMIYASTAALLKTEIDNLRGKLGVRDKLTVKFDDGTLRWQWARLRRVDIPRPAEFNAPVLPYALEWITAAQYWFQIINSPAEWTVGDSTWLLGDGTAEIGESGTQVTLTATGATGTAPPAGGTTQGITETHDGNRDATNIVFTVTAGTSDIDAIKIANAGDSRDWYFGATVPAGNVLSVNCGTLAVTNNGANAYSDFTPSDRVQWMAFPNGDNVMTVTLNGNATLDATLGIEYYDHYA